MKTEQNLKLEIKRVINAPRNRVYAAWTDPAQLKQWFGPEKVQTRDLIADARAGGEFNGHTNVAALLVRVGREDKAIQHLEAARRIQPDSPNVLRQLAELYDRGGDKEKADAARQALQAADAKQALASTEER